MTTIESQVIELIDQLSAEHAELLPHVDELAGLAEARDQGLSQAIEGLAALLGEALDAHIAQEDDVLFPAYAEETGNEGLVQQFVEEHREIQSLRDELRALAADGGAALRLASITLSLADLLHSHMEREENVLFPSARHALS